MTSSVNRPNTKMGPWKLFRILLRVFSCGVLLWFIFLSLWLALPFPAVEKDGDSGSDYATSVLRAGRQLTRVYTRRVQSNDRDGFALDYRLHHETLALSIDGPGQSLFIPLVNEDGDRDSFGAVVKFYNSSVRIGDVDGANLPWFASADAILLFWEIHREWLDLEVMVKWIDDGDQRTMRLWPSLTAHTSPPLIELHLEGSDPATIFVTVPASPESSSPSWTYPLRVAIISVLAPTAVYVNTHCGSFFMAIIDFLTIPFVISVYSFCFFAVIFSLWRVLRGPSLESVVAWIQGRLEHWKQNERLRVLRLDKLQEWIEWVHANERVQVFINVCQGGWRPELQRRAVREQEHLLAQQALVHKKTNLVHGDLELGIGNEEIERERCGNVTFRRATGEAPDGLGSLPKC